MLSVTACNSTPSNLLYTKNGLFLVSRAKFKFKSLRFERAGSGEQEVMVLELFVLVERFPNPITISF